MTEIFEIEKQAEVQDDRGGQKRFPGGGRLSAGDEQPAEIVQHDDRQHQQKVFQTAEPVEDKACEKEDDVFAAPFLFRGGSGKKADPVI